MSKGHSVALLDMSLRHPSCYDGQQQVCLARPAPNMQAPELARIIACIITLQAGCSPGSPCHIKAVLAR
jgi:hypothetical protein